MKQNDQKETPELAWSSDETTTRNTSQNIIIEALRTTKRKRGKAKTTWLKVIEEDLSGNVKLDVFKDPAANNYISRSS